MLKYNGKRVLLVLMIAAMVMCMPTQAFASVLSSIVGGGDKFSALTKAGGDIFQGLRDIIYPASAIGIIAVCMGGFFGNINWKWLTAIVVGLIVISCCVAFVSMFSPEAAKSIPQDIMRGS